jgi:hypothetical protein
MPTMTSHRPRSRLLAFAIVLPVLAMLLATTAVAAPKKPYATDISPDTVLAGRCTAYTVWIENKTTTQQLGSANYTLDPRFGGLSCQLVAGTPFPPTITSNTSGGQGTISVDSTNHVLQLRDLALASPVGDTPGGRVTFTFSAMTSCPPGTSPYKNSVIAKQANNYSGDPGNNMTPDDPFDTWVDVVGTCSDGSDGHAPAAITQPGTDDEVYSDVSYSLVSNGTANGRLILAAGYQFVDCLDYVEHTDTVTADLVFNTTDTKTLTLIFNNVNDEPKSAFRFCYDPDEDGPAPPALAPNCQNKDPDSTQNVPPCVLDVTEKNHKITMKVLLKAGDLKGRG